MQPHVKEACMVARPTPKAAAAPLGDSERFRRPRTAITAARTSATAALSGH
jgi:hypothetical protein